ncbi:hypothetical protein ABZ960_17145, partial [Streptomyces pseudovenezuelae]|uniref:MmyB family transcriptional regulator n=1 Tax=Streptomyces pseudovenezuelae TaxID=67350 RepID=UPI0034BB7EEE
MRPPDPRLSCPPACHRPRLTNLVGELLLRSADFAGPWERCESDRPQAGPQAYRYQQAGTLTLTFQSLHVEGTPGQHIGVYTAEPATPDHDAPPRHARTTAYATARPRHHRTQSHSSNIVGPVRIFAGQQRSEALAVSKLSASGVWGQQVMPSVVLKRGMGSFFKECEHPRSRWSKCPHLYKIRYRAAG